MPGLGLIMESRANQRCGTANANATARRAKRPNNRTRPARHSGKPDQASRRSRETAWKSVI